MTNLSKAEEEAISKLLDRTAELLRLDKLEEAERFLGEVEKYKPGDINIAFQRGIIFVKKDAYEKALKKFMEVHERKPVFFENLNNMATAYYNVGKFDEAITFYREALKIKPDASFVMSALGVCLSRNGQVNEAIQYFRDALEISQEINFVHSDFLLTMVYAESVSPEELTEESKKFGENIAKTHPQKIRLAHDKTKDRKIRVGYISPDFRDHPVPYFLEPLLKNHDRKKFEVYAYSNTVMDNPIMDRMKSCVDVWRDIRRMKDEERYDLIVEDRIDILVDVSGHTANNNLRVFAYKPAPIQVSWMGYPATTGMKVMDYRITDPYAEPPGMTEHLNVEKLWRLPHIFCCYMPHEGSPDVIDHPPFEDNGYITFGCFNNFTKVRDPVLAVWKKILNAVPESRLFLEILSLDLPKVRNSVQERLIKQGLPLDRVIMEPRKSENQFKLYNKIDLALDPFPCNGGTTSFDTLWMGVPFVTLEGKNFVSRMGTTILTNAGLAELIAPNTEEYISIAVDLATNKERLKDIRRNLREKFKDSPAMDQKLFAHDMEEAYLGMWGKYCGTGN